MEPKEEALSKNTDAVVHTLSQTHMAIVGFCHVWHNDFCVSFSSHSARVQESSLIGYTAAED